MPDATMSDVEIVTTSSRLAEVIADASRRPRVALDIESIVQELGHEVVAIADTKDTAVEAAMEHRPDLVLADIQLADGSSGIDAVKEIDARTRVAAAEEIDKI